MSLAEAPRFTPGKQMLAAIGQPRLIAFYDQFFRMFGQISAQVLLTREDLTDRNRYLNARGTIEGLLEGGIVPIINENDTVATEEIRFGDNDNLCALVASLVEADLLLLLTDQAGLYTGDPRKDENARLIHRVEQVEIPEEYGPQLAVPITDWVPVAWSQNCRLPIWRAGLVSKLLSQLALNQM